jgi:acyl carrier protein
MGLEIVELVMNIEDEFNIELSESEAAVAYEATVRDLSDVVAARLGESVNECTPDEFLRAFSAAGAVEKGIAADKVTAHSTLRELFPRRDREALWGRVQSRLAREGLRLFKFSNRRRTVGDVARAMSRMDADDVARRVRELVAEQAGKSAETISPDDRLSKYFPYG